MLNLDLDPRTKLARYHDEIIKELLEIKQFKKDVHKDILIVVHDQPEHIKKCLNSIKENTSNYKVWIWDNNSNRETIEILLDRLEGEYKNFEVFCHWKNDGFIVPNNKLIKESQSDYIILLNSDTEVYKGWDTALIAYLEKGYAQVGYMGGLLNEKGEGAEIAFGENIDFIPAWCTAINRKTYKKYGLFDEKHLEFAYCEDADFSLRLKEGGEKIYALHLDLVYHHGNKTIDAVYAEKEVDVERTFAKNHEWMRERWANYLANDRVLVHTP